jgi:hypothetical protein
MVSVLASSTADLGIKPRLGQTKYCNIGMCCFSTKQAVLRRKSKGWLARDTDDASEWGLFNELATIEIQLCVLFKYKIDLIIISLKMN